MLELKNIQKSYEIRSGRQQVVLKNLNVHYPSKGFIAILGTSGSGKTTLLNIIGGLDQQDSGTLHYNREIVVDYESFRCDRIGFVFQEFNLVKHLSGIDNVILSISDEVTDKKKRAKEIMLSLDLEDCLHKLPMEMSGGQKQRVAIARMIAKDVDIIICDEPTGSLDEGTGLKVVEILKTLSKDKLVLFVTHDHKLALEHSDRVIEMSDGQIDMVKEVERVEVIDKDKAIDNVEAIDCEENKSDGSIFSQVAQHKSYHSNVVWLALKNLVGRRKNTLKYGLLIGFIMLLSAMSMVLQGEIFRKNIHDNAIDQGLMIVRYGIEKGEDIEGLIGSVEGMENIDYIGVGYESRVGIATSNYLSSRKSSETGLEAIRNVNYFEDKLIEGRLPENSSEVLMSTEGVILLMQELMDGGQRIYDRYMTGEISSAQVFDLVDYRQFIVTEYGYPKVKVVGLLDANIIYENHQTIYFHEGFKDLFEYPGGLYPTELRLYKSALYREANDVIIDGLDKHQSMRLNEGHQDLVTVVYNKLESFLDLSRISLYVIVAIATISYISLLFVSLFERKYEVGLYRSIGYRSKDIVRILGLEMFFTGMVSLILVMLLLFISGLGIYMSFDYIETLASALEIINIGNVVLVLFGVVLVLITTVIYIGHRAILRESVLMNLKSQ